MPDQSGIGRRRTASPEVHVSATENPEALARDVRILYDVIRELQRSVQLLEDHVTRRLNEILQSGTLANRPPAGIQDRIYLASDQAAGSRLTYDTGSAWTAP